MSQRFEPDTIDAIDHAGGPGPEPKPAKAGLLLSQGEAWRYLGLARSSWYRLRAAGKLPSPVSVYGTGPRWRRADLDAWVARLKPARRKTSPA
jgi:predicted DNA-binding transcriptional regulator AlpA